MADDTTLANRIRSLAEPLAAAHAAEVLDVVVKGGKGRRLVRVTADAAALDASAGLDIDTIAALSRQLGSALDEQDLVPGAYDLEVTSPGADRPLRRPRDFARNVGREVRLHLAEGCEGPDGGTVVTVTDSELTLDADGAEVTIPLADVDHGTVVLPW
jgi:ribosome maturation factor RimP